MASQPLKIIQGSQGQSPCNIEAEQALIGSIYLDRGFQTVEKIIMNLWDEHIKKSVITPIDAKTKLQ